MKKKLVSIVQYCFFLGLGIFLLWWSLQGVDSQGWQQIRTAFANAHYGIIFPIVIALLASHYSRAMRWRILMEPLGYSPRIANTYLAVLIGYMANLAVPRLGEILKCTVLARYEKVPADKLVGTIVAERAFDVICLLLVMAAAFFTQTDLFGDYLGSRLKDIAGAKKDSFTLTRLFTLLGIGTALLLLGWYLLRRFAHLTVIRKLKTILRGIWQGVTSVKHVKKKAWFLVHTLFIWAMYLLSVRLGFLALEETMRYSWKPALSVLTSGSLAMIMPSPGGLGFYPVFVQSTMELYGLKQPIGFAFGALMWAVQFFQMLFSGFVALALFPIINKKPVAHAKP